MTIESSNVRKKINEPLNVTRVQSHVMLVLHNMRIELLNVREKKGTTKCDKSVVKCYVGTTKCDDKIIKCEKKK